MTWTPNARSTSTNRGRGGAGRVYRGRGAAKPAASSLRYAQRLDPVPEDRARCHVPGCWRVVRLRQDGTMYDHAYCLGAGIKPEPIA